jgi:hypothetical protein
MMQPMSAPALRPVEQAGRLLGSMIAAGRPRPKRKSDALIADTRAAALDIWIKGGRSLAATDDDVEAFVNAYQDAYLAYARS